MQVTYQKKLKTRGRKPNTNKPQQNQKKNKNQPKN